MSKTEFKQWESLEEGSSIDTQKVIDALCFNEKGLIPVIAQQYNSKSVLMMAWMNREALEETLQTGRVCYYSRSRQSLWRKGESSGHVQSLKSLRIDCDGDCLLVSVDQKGAACHTFRPNCFFFHVEGNNVTISTATE